MSFRLASPTQVRLRNGKLALTGVSTPGGGGEEPPPTGNAATSLTLTDIAQPVLQRVGTSKTVTVEVAYEGSPDAIQARIVDHTTGAQVTAWTTIATAPTSSPASGPLVIPQGKNYRLQTRDSVNTALISSGTMRFGVGMITLNCGQSNAFNSYTTADKYPSSDGKSAFEWDRLAPGFRRLGHQPVPDTFPNNTLYPTGYTSFLTPNAANKGDGPVFYANIVSDSLGIPVMQVMLAVSGSSIDQWLPSGNCWTNLLNALVAVGGDAEHATMHQGEQNAAAMAKATYKTKFGQFHANLMTAVGRDTSSFKLGVMVVGVGPYTGSTPGEFGDIRTAHVEYANSTAGAYLMSSAHDGYTNSGTDTVHLEKTSLSKIWRRAGKTTASQYGVGTSGAGPRITGATRSGTTVTVTIAHAGGTALQDGTGGTGTALTGFQFFDAGAAGAEIAYTSAISGNTLVMTLASAPTGALTMSYAMQDAPHGTPTSQGLVLASCVYDNATYLNSGMLGCPLQPCAAIEVL